MYVATLSRSMRDGSASPCVALEASNCSSDYILVPQWGDRYSEVDYMGSFYTMELWYRVQKQLGVLHIKHSLWKRTQHVIRLRPPNTPKLFHDLRFPAKIKGLKPISSSQ